ncbi:MAG: hypothetical protein AB7G23_19165 [Vicinamibacterales bacterium]
MTWFGVYREDTGDLVSLGTVVANPLPAGLAAQDLGATRPDLADAEWDPTLRAMKPRVRPPATRGLVDRVVDRVKGKRSLAGPIELAIRQALAEEGVE